MTPAEIEDVQKAWKVDPRSRPTHSHAILVYMDAAWVWIGDGWSQPDFADPHIEGRVHAALHRRLLELGAFIQPAAGNGYLVYNQTNQGSIAWSPDSLIIAMARGIIALAKENP